MPLVHYAGEHFVRDASLLNTNRCNTIAESILNDLDTRFFGGHHWEKYLQDTAHVLQGNLAYYCFCLFTMTCADQNMYAHFREKYSEFRNRFRYPKFGWCGFGSHCEAPRYLLDIPCIQHDIDFNVITDTEIEEFLKSQYSILDGIFGAEFRRIFFREMLNDDGFYAECGVFKRLRIIMEHTHQK